MEKDENKEKDHIQEALTTLREEYPDRFLYNEEVHPIRRIYSGVTLIPQGLGRTMLVAPISGEIIPFKSIEVKDSTDEKRLSVKVELHGKWGQETPEAQITHIPRPLHTLQDIRIQVLQTQVREMRKELETLKSRGLWARILNKN